VPSSCYYLPKPWDREAALRYLRDGQMLSCYLGHSRAEALDVNFLQRSDFRKLNIPIGNGPFFTCGCFGCEFNGKGDGYGVAAMRNPGGPVAVMGATGESYAAAGQLAVEGLLSCLGRAPFPVRLADYWLGVQSGLARGKMDTTTFLLFDMADGSGGTVPLETQRLEHLEMWMLLGDPALRLPIVPMDISLKAVWSGTGRRTLAVEGTLPRRLSGAAVRVALERPHNSMPVGLQEVPAGSAEDPGAREKAFKANHERANSFVLTSAEASGTAQHFAVSLGMPADAPWTNIVIRASATVSNDTGIGAVEGPVSPPP
jgi:hypothetical protein